MNRRRAQPPTTNRRPVFIPDLVCDLRLERQIWFAIFVCRFDLHFTVSIWRIGFRALAEVLGKGSAGTSYKAVLEEGTTVVVKRLKDVVVMKKEFKMQMEATGSSTAQKRRRRRGDSGLSLPVQGAPTSAIRGGSRAAPTLSPASPPSTEPGCLTPVSSLYASVSVQARQDNQLDTAKSRNQSRSI
ncbi:hypothetical protein U1Q18_028188 [Sarracenia purpurea var. burkii]